MEEATRRQLAGMGGSGALTLGNVRLAVSRLDKHLWPIARVTKRDLLQYYALVWPQLALFLAGRPLTVKRCPSGNLGRCFIQKDLNDAPKAVRILDVLAQTTGEVIQIPVVERREALLWLGQIAAVELHGWLARFQKPRERFSSKRALLASSLNRPDVLVFDLDPPEKTGSVLAAFRKIAHAAERVLAFCESGGIKPFIKTSGKYGVHLFLPMKPTVDFETARTRFKALCQKIAARWPEMFTLEERKAKRQGRVLLDYSQNSLGRTTVLPWSPRAVDAATISMPLRVSELRTADPRKFTIPWALQHLPKTDPWENFFRKPYAWGQVERLIE